MSWFGGDSPRTEAEEAFVAQLRQQAQELAALGVQPSDTRVIAAIDPLCVEVHPPELPLPANGQSTTLQGGFWNRGAADLVLQAEWADDMLLDAAWNEDHISLGGVDLPAEDVARLLSTWFVSQLRRPLVRAEWVDAVGHLLASETRLADSGRVLATHGSRWRRRREATRSVTLRDGVERGH